MDFEKIIENQTFDAERALYHSENTLVRNCVFAGPNDGESVLKESRNVRVENCKFSLRYPMWHIDKYRLINCDFDDKTRAPIWYSKNGYIKDSRLMGIKLLGDCRDTAVENCRIESPEFGWKCTGITLKDTQIDSQYIFFDSRDVKLENVKFTGKYSFQYMENLYIENSVLDTKDAFWHSKNITVKNSTLKGEYLRWFSENLTLMDCTVIGTQPLCYCKGLKLINCRMEGCDLAFEYSDVQADVTGHIDSVKNPKSGTITADSVGEIIMADAVMPTEGKVVIRNK